MSDSFATTVTVACQTSLSIRSWGGLPFPSPGDLPDPSIEPASPALAGRFFTTEPSGRLQWGQGAEINEEFGINIYTLLYIRSGFPVGSGESRIFT